MPGSFVLEIEVLADIAGNLRIFAGWNGCKFKEGSGFDHNVLSPGKWVTVTQDISSDDVLTALRIDPPGTAGKSLFRNIRLKNGYGKVLKEWFVSKDGQ